MSDPERLSDIEALQVDEPSMVYGHPMRHSLLDTGVETVAGGVILLGLGIVGASEVAKGGKRFIGAAFQKAANRVNNWLDSDYELSPDARHQDRFLK